MTRKYEIESVGLRTGWGDRDPINGQTHPTNTGVVITWTAKGIGFGEITLSQDPTGRVRFGTETMSKEFCMAVLEKLYDDAEKHNG